MNTFRMLMHSARTLIRAKRRGAMDPILWRWTGENASIPTAWSCWLESEPEKKFYGANGEEALRRLYESLPK